MKREIPSPVVESLFGSDCIKFAVYFWTGKRTVGLVLLSGFWCSLLGHLHFAVFLFFQFNTRHLWWGLIFLRDILLWTFGMSEGAYIKEKKLVLLKKCNQGTVLCRELVWKCSLWPRFKNENMERCSILLWCRFLCGRMTNLQICFADQKKILFCCSYKWNPFFLFLLIFIIYVKQELNKSLCLLLTLLSF